MNIYNIIITLTILGILTYLVVQKKNKKIEGYWDITPYDLHWDMFKCLDMDCLKKKTKKCHDWCDNWGEPGGRENCRLRCMDYADQYAEQLKLNNVIWNRILPRFQYTRLHSNL